MELHQQAADILLQDAAGCTLLHHAVEAGSKKILKYLVDNGEGTERKNTVFPVFMCRMKSRVVELTC